MESKWKFVFLQQLVWDTYDRKRNPGKRNTSSTSILESASDAPDGIEDRPSLSKTRSKIPPPSPLQPPSKSPYKETDQGGLTDNVAYSGQAVDSSASRRCIRFPPYFYLGYFQGENDLTLKYCHLWMQ